MKLRFLSICCVAAMIFSWHSFAMLTIPEQTPRNSAEYRDFPHMEYIGIHAENLPDAQELAPPCPKLQCLDIYGDIDENEQKLNALSNLLSKTPNLRAIFLERNMLIRCPREIGNLQNLRTLHLAKNQLTSLPTELSNLRNLQNLYLGGNRFEIFPVVIFRLKNLKRLHIEENLITKLPYALWEISGLKEVIIDRFLVPQVPRYTIVNEIIDTSVINCLSAWKNHFKLTDQQLDLMINNDFIIKKINIDEINIHERVNQDGRTDQQLDLRINTYEWVSQEGWRAIQQPANSNFVRVSLSKHLLFPQFLSVWK
ncbi:MAG: leucine-rich repeat domain-containing protein [Alphaproteobacteria bacterium]|nr:leucine-rich repeat domain-containing protein [Alphaproteobacteria bacterium]